MRILLESSREWLRQDKSFVQGLFYDKDNILYESSGLYGQSAIRKLELDGAYGVIRTRKITSVPKEIFAEGLTPRIMPLTTQKDEKKLANSKRDVQQNPQMILLTWKEDDAMVYDMNTFTLAKDVSASASAGSSDHCSPLEHVNKITDGGGDGLKYEGSVQPPPEFSNGRILNFNLQFERREGWGITTTTTTTNTETKENTQLQSYVVSDGSCFLYFVDPISFQVEKQICVRDPEDDFRQIDLLNELEWITIEYKDDDDDKTSSSSFILANVWQTNDILVIRPETGLVLGYLDASEIKKHEQNIDHDVNDVLNGIAYDKTRDVLFITGKRWARVYEIHDISTHLAQWK